MSKIIKLGMALLLAAASAVCFAGKAPANSPPTVAITSPTTGSTFPVSSAVTITATASDKDGTIAKVDFYRGKTLIGSKASAPYTISWSSSTTGTYSITAKATDNGGATATSTAVSITIAASTNKAPSVSLTSPASGATFAAPAAVTLTANATDSDGTVSKVDFYQGTTLIGSSSQPPFSAVWNVSTAGTYSLTAKATDNAGATTSSTAVSVTISAASNVGITGPTDGATVYSTSVVVSGTFVGDSNTSVWIDNGNSTLLAQISGNTFSATTPIFIGQNKITVTVVRTDKTFDVRTITVNGNDYPQIVFTGPDQQTFTAPANISFSVDALSPTGSINKVVFTQGSTVLATLTQPPYQFTWQNVAAGNYTVAAQAVDDRGYNTSVYKGLSIQNAGIPPTVSLTSPANGAAFTAPANITLNADAADSDGTISRVEFYAGSTLIGSTNVSPYSLAWQNVAAGSYAITAKAIDNSGSATTSNVVNITVNPPSAIQFTSPQNNASYTVPALVNLTVTTTQSVLGMSFYRMDNGTPTLIGDSPNTSSPYSYAWNNKTPGTYTVRAAALVMVAGFDQPMQYWSDPITITIAPNLTGETITYLHNDALGSPIAATDVNGSVVWKEDYMPYGERLVNAPDAGGNRQFFTGKPVDSETGLSYFGARYYDPAMGRFMGIDPVEFREGNLHSFNRFTYANNNPYKFIDPDGRRDVYIGGAADKNNTRIVQDYAAAQQQLHPERDIQYFSYSEKKKITEAINAPLKEGEPLNVIGHSLGGREAVRQANSTDAQITNLVTIDPVGSSGNGSKPSNVGTWTDVTAVPSKRNSSDTVASMGRFVFGTTATSGADSSQKQTASHGDFPTMMSNGSQQKVDASY